MKCHLYTDGGSRGNPGKAAAGSILKNSTGETIAQKGTFLGIKTNNEAEYMALVQGLQLALENKCTEIVCFLDSELIVNQLNGKYKMKNANLKQFFDKIKLLETNFKSTSYSHVFREKNKEADALVNETLDNEMTKTYA